MSLSRRVVLGTAFAFAVAGSALAASHSSFTAPALKSAQDAGKSILVEVTAPWCPTCKAQKPILSSLLAEPRFKDTQVLTVDFDSQKGALKQLGVSMQSTLIVYKGRREMGRSTGVTDPKQIEALLTKAL